MFDIERPWAGSEFTRALDDVRTPLHIASLFGWTDIVEQLLSPGANIHARGGSYCNAQAASYSGHEKTVGLLLTVNAQGRYYSNALQVASVRGYSKIAKMLLSKSANVNAQGGYHGDALQAASAQGHMEIVKILLSNGSNVNDQGAQGGFFNADGAQGGRYTTHPRRH
ncbi:hypothetical protein VC83_08121 [Pseudogymnoascus destructans]|uniref:Uncharacterized protein n=2 Tax=Pseudogymnoascus destructans TaxID=655981 RepID=L8FTR1_PSED2|nr:uncharacterized protein VC83_08121 [Pseudogymnoascus destructans]ELR04355.1 hypothetical protein GMDG_06730 [Pseudogymnoascus destructans 20631-21]OAF55321.1 hypothetical protein VC83_08121 [Pseudogymnoascus destructans]